MQKGKGKYIAGSIIAALVIAIVGLTGYLSLPSTQIEIGKYFAEMLSRKLGTEVGLERASYSFPNTFTLEGIVIDDQEGRELMKASELSLSINIPTLLLERNIDIHSISINQIKALLVQEADSTLNFQFVVDSLSSTGSGGGSMVHLSECNIKSLSATFQSIPSKTKASMENAGFSFSDIDIGDESVSVLMPSLSFNRLTIDTPSKSYQSDAFSMEGDITLVQGPEGLKCRIGDSSVRVGSKVFEDCNLDVLLKGNTLSVKEIDIDSKDFLTVRGKGEADFNTGYIDAEMEKVAFSPEFISFASSLFDIDQKVMDYLTPLGSIEFAGDCKRAGSSDEEQIFSAGTLTTDLGKLETRISYSSGIIDANLSTEDFEYGRIISDSLRGKVTVEADLTIDPSDILSSSNRIRAVLPQFSYKDVSLSNMTLDLKASDRLIGGMFKMDDPKLRIDSRFSFCANEKNPKDIHDIKLSVDMNSSKESYRRLLGKDSPESIALSMDADLSGIDPLLATGDIDIHSVSVVTSKENYALNDAKISISPLGNEERNITIVTDFLDASLSGRIDPLTIHESFLSQIGHHLPSLNLASSSNDNAFSFDIRLDKSEFLGQLVPDSVVDFGLVEIKGEIDSPNRLLHMDIETPMLKNGDLAISSIKAAVSSDDRRLSAVVSGSKASEEGNGLDVSLEANALDDRILSTVSLSTSDKKTLSASLSSDARLSRNDDGLSSEIGITPSWISFKNDRWDILPSSMTVSGGTVRFNDVRISSEDRFLSLDGDLSASTTDTLRADFNGFEIAYLQDLLNFHPVRFGGRMSGQAVLSQLLDKPNVQAHVKVDSLLFQEGYMGAADINVGWDPEIKGVTISADIVDSPSSPLMPQAWPIKRTTTVRGYVAPGEVRDDIQLTITADNTSAAFIHGFLGGVFRSVTGDVNGVMRVTTGPDGVNLIGDMSVDADLQLRATDIVYHVDGKDLIHFVPNAFKFQDVHITDRNGHQGVVNGQLSHRKLRGLSYDFNIDFNDLLVYDEKEFNSDKFLATVSGSGNLTIKGKDGYYVNLNANVTPSKGSVFAYDAATPDAINKGQFIKFRSRNEAEGSDDDAEAKASTSKEKGKDDYSSDIVFDINMHVTPDCAIKLRMDNNEDGYITAYGSGDIVGRYHNKNPFTLQGIYQIESGKYRLFLQDMIYRDLQLQPGSNVVFNGAPFGAAIHLICNHTLSSVPLRDLTTSVEFLQNSSAKVVCIMDITGTLGNMNFGFNIDLPNVSDETRQMVHSLISTEEEMNMQMIYLLGLGRFYTNEIARAQGKTGTGSEMSSLVSSTLSGQINNMLDNFMGEKSNWNIGTGLSTGEKGWDNLDVEGNLSGRLLDDRLLINGNFGYRDNTLTNKSNFIGDFDIKYKLFPNHDIYIKGYNQTNDKYFTKSTLTTQGIGLSIQKDFDSFMDIFRKSTILPKSLSEINWQSNK